MVTIHKYQFGITDRVQIEMPVHAEILSVQVQNGIPTMWAKVNTNNKTAIRTFVVFGTGHEINHLFNYEHIATIQLDEFVWHIFE